MATQKYGIDPDRIRPICTKIKYYADQEEDYIMDIVSALNIIQSAYDGSETNDVLNEKIQFITTILYVLLENRRNYVNCLNSVISSYLDQNQYFAANFNQITPQFK